MADDDSYLTARQYLQQHRVLCLASCKDTVPWVAPVFYAKHSDKLIFLSAPHTRHCKNIAANPWVSASIQEDYSDWKDIKGFQLQGVVSPVPADGLTDVISAYSKKFPLTGVDAPAEIAAALDKIQWFEMSITKLFFIDNARGFGHRDELDPAHFFSK